eukprot:11511623-Alexandrium_andersonii.AAC.1
MDDVAIEGKACRSKEEGVATRVTSHPSAGVGIAQAVGGTPWRETLWKLRARLSKTTRGQAQQRARGR